MSYDDMAAKRDVIALNNLNAGMRLIDAAADEISNLQGVTI